MRPARTGDVSEFFGKVNDQRTLLVYDSCINATYIGNTTSDGESTGNSQIAVSYPCAMMV